MTHDSPDRPHGLHRHAPAARVLGVALALLLPTACGSPPPPRTVTTPPPTTRPDDVVCPCCTMHPYAWDSTPARGTGSVHHDARVMECPYCVNRTAGVWSVVGPSHTCDRCTAGVDRCPMCRAADAR